MTQEEKRNLEAELSALDQREENLMIALDEIEKSKEFKKLGKDELKKEVAIRRKLDKIDSRREEIYSQLETERTLTRNRIIASVSIIALAGVLGIVLGKAIRKNCAPSETVVPEKAIVTTVETKVPSRNVIVEAPTAAPTITPAAKKTAEPTATPTAVPTAAPVIVDPTDDEEVEEVAIDIYSNAVNEILVENPALANFATPEAIEDIIRMANGVLPKYSNYNEYTIASTANLMNDVFANQGNGNELYPFDFARLYPADSNEAKYLQEYDDIYRKIAEYRAEGNGDGVVEQCGLLASKVYNEWHLAGLYGGWNPYLFPYQEQYFLLQASTSRFSNYVREYLEANDLTVCIPACYDVENEGYKLVEIRDIFEALYMGTSKNKAISVMRSGDVINVFGETYADAQDYFNRRSSYVKGLN